MNSVLFFVMNALLVATAHRIAVATVGGREPGRRLVATFTLIPLLVYVIVLPLAVAGWLGPVAALALLSGLFAATFLLPSRAPADRPAARNDDRSLPLEAWVGISLLVAAAGTLLLSRFLKGTSFNTDDLDYHATFVGHLVQDGALSWLPSGYHAYFAYNAELLSAWLMLPVGDDRFVYLAGVFWVALACLSIAAICRQSAADERTGATAYVGAAMFAASGVVWFMASTFGPTDLTMPAMLLAALALAMPSSEQAADDGSWRIDSLYVGAATGFAIGAKITAGPIALVLWLWMLLLRPDRARGRDLLRTTVGMGVVIAGFGAFWYLRNWVGTGNPLFPAEVAFFSGPFLKDDQVRTSLAWWFSQGLTGAQWRTLIEGYLNWPLPLALLAGLGYALAVVRLALPGSSEPTANRLATALLLVAGGLALVLWPFTPFSGTVNAPEAQPLVLPMRLLFPFGAGLCLFALAGAAQRPDGPGYRAWWAVVLVAALTMTVPRTNVALALGLLTPIGLLVATRLRLRQPARTGGVLTLVALLAIAGVFGSFSRDRADAKLWAMGARYGLDGGWRALTELPRGASIALYGPRMFRDYPYLGRSLHLRLLYLDAEGLPRPPVHVEWQNGEYTWWRAHEELALDLEGVHPDAFVANLLRSGADYVFVDALPERLPPQLELLERSDSARVVFRDGGAVIYSLDTAP